MQGIGKRNTATSGNRWQDLEERERTKRLENGAGGIGQKDTVRISTPCSEKDISEKFQTENNTLQSLREFHPDTMVQHERKVRIGL